MNSVHTLILAFSCSAAVGILYTVIQKSRGFDCQLRGKEHPFLPFLALGFLHYLNRKYKAVYTVEVAYIMPLIILIISGVVISGFYLHDKNILYSKVYELGSIARQENRTPHDGRSIELEEVLINNCKGKLLLFQFIECEIEERDDVVRIYAKMEFMSKSVSIERVFAIDNVEENLRAERPVI